MGQQENCFTWETKVRSLLVIQMGLSCAVVEAGASSTGNGLAQVCTRAELGSRPEQRCKADFFEVMACCQNTEFAMREKQSHPASLVLSSERLLGQKQTLLQRPHFVV